MAVKIPEELLDEKGYPTEEWLQFIRNYKSEEMPIHDFLKLLVEGWQYADWGVQLSRSYKGKQKLELHTGGWSGNEETIKAILDNFYLTHFDLKYVMWRTGGHYYFELKAKPPKN